MSIIGNHRLDRAFLSNPATKKKVDEVYDGATKYFRDAVKRSSMLIGEEMACDAGMTLDDFMWYYKPKRIRKRSRREMLRKKKEEARMSGRDYFLECLEHRNGDGDLTHVRVKKKMLRMNEL